MRRLIPSAILVLNVLAASGSAQNATWVVDAAMGPGAHYKDIPAALIRAVDSDRVIVRRGNYSAFNLVRGVTIIGEPGAEVASFFPHAVNVSGVPAGRTAAIHNLRLSALSVSNSRGRVILERLQHSLTGHVSLTVTGSSQVHLIDSGMIHLDVTGSRLIARGSRFGWGSPGVSVGLRNSQVSLAGCDVTGGWSWTNGASAIFIDGTSTLTLTDDGSARVSVPGYAVGTSAVIGSGALILDPRVVIRTGKNTPPIARGITVTRRGVPFLTARGAPIGGTVSVTLKSLPNQPYFLAVGLPGKETSFPSLGGFVWLNLQSAVLISSGRLDAAGEYKWSTPVPRDNALLGLALVWQGTAGPAVNRQTLSNPSAYIHGR